MSEFWLISAPGQKTTQQTWESCKAKSEEFSMIHKFNLPDLKVGTLDTLVGLSDELAKLDQQVEGNVKKLANYFMDVLEEKQDKVMENLQVNDMYPEQYLTKFSWHKEKYPMQLPLKKIAEIISVQVSKIDGDLKTKATTYNNIKNNLQSLERKEAGSLLTRNLASIAKKEHFVLGSEYLQTLLVVVPRSSSQDWLTTYEKLTDMIVPNSSQLVIEDNEHSLFTVTMFKKVVEEFKHHAREMKFVVRDFVWDDSAIAANKEQLTKLAQDKKKQFGPLVRWLRVNFGELFIAWVHVKALRVFVESVLRYGLPVNFQAMILQPNKGKTRKLRDTLDSLYAYLDGQQSGTNTDHVDIPGLAMAQGEYFSYVYLNMKVNLFDR